MNCTPFTIEGVWGDLGDLASLTRYHDSKSAGPDPSVLEWGQRGQPSFSWNLWRDCFYLQSLAGHTFT
jgi:hypothetical protein